MYDFHFNALCTQTPNWTTAYQFNDRVGTRDIFATVDPGRENLKHWIKSGQLTNYSKCLFQVHSHGQRIGVELLLREHGISLDNCVIYVGRLIDLTGPVIKSMMSGVAGFVGFSFFYVYYNGFMKLPEWDWLRSLDSTIFRYDAEMSLSFCSWYSGGWHDFISTLRPAINYRMHPDTVSRFASTQSNWTHLIPGGISVNKHSKQWALAQAVMCGLIDKFDVHVRSSNVFVDRHKKYKKMMNIKLRVDEIYPSNRDNHAGVIAHYSYLRRIFEETFISCKDAGRDRGLKAWATMRGHNYSKRELIKMSKKFKAWKAAKEKAVGSA